LISRLCIKHTLLYLLYKIRDEAMKKSQYLDFTEGDLPAK
jgi:hypothetical protein